MHFGRGCAPGIRNLNAHGTGELPNQEALEYLAALSVLARWVKECEVVPAAPKTPKGTAEASPASLRVLTNMNICPGPQGVYLFVADRCGVVPHLRAAFYPANGSSLIQPCACTQRRNDPRAVRRLFHVAAEASPQRFSRTRRTRLAVNPSRARSAPRSPTTVPRVWA